MISDKQVAEKLFVVTTPAGPVVGRIEVDSNGDIITRDNGLIRVYAPMIYMEKVQEGQTVGADGKRSRNISIGFWTPYAAFTVTHMDLVPLGVMGPIDNPQLFKAHKQASSMARSNLIITDKMPPEQRPA